jgi:predicted phage terminase large subunit-like protein
MNANERLVAKYKCLNSLEFFTRYFFKKKNNTKFIVSEHHKIIINTLERIVKGELKRVIFNMPPRYGKTELIVKNFIAHCLSLNQKAKFIHLSYSDSLALDNSEEIKDLLSQEYYKELFPEVEIKKDSRAKNKWYTTKNGGVLARSSSGQVTGFGAGIVDDEDEKEFLTDLEKMQAFGGAIIIDDPIKPDDANSDTIRDKINNKFETTIRNRTNSRNTPIIVVMQRLNQMDLCGYLIDAEPEEWHVVSLPAIKDDGTALWEHKHTVEELYKIKKANDFVFETQYMQNPMPNIGLLFAKSSLTFATPPTEFDAKLAYIDIADTGSDDHCCVIGALRGNKIYIIDVIYTKESTDTNVQLTADILNKHTPEYCRIESNMGGGMYRNLLQPKVSNLVQLLAVRNSTNKHVRIMTLSGFIKEFCVFRDDYEINSDYDRFMRNLTTYLKDGKAQHDDAPDALQGLAKMFRAFYKHVWNDYYVEGKD